MPTPSMIRQYEILERVRSLPYGELYRAVEQSSQYEVQIILLSDTLRNNDRFMLAFHTTMEKFQRVAHPNILKILDYGDDTQTYVVMERRLSESLGEVLAKNKKLPLPFVNRLLAGLVSAIETLDSLGMQHYQLIPERIYFRADGAITLTDIWFDEANQACGYVIPPDSRCQLPDEPADLLAAQHHLARLVYELLTGNAEGWQNLHSILKSPSNFSASGLKNLPIRTAVWLILRTALDPDRSQRFTDLDTFVNLLKTAADSPPAPSQQETPLSSALDKAQSRSSSSLIKKDSHKQLQKDHSEDLFPWWFILLWALSQLMFTGGLFRGYAEYFSVSPFYSGLELLSVLGLPEKFIVVAAGIILQGFLNQGRMKDNRKWLISSVLSALVFIPVSLILPSEWDPFKFFVYTYFLIIKLFQWFFTLRHERKGWMWIITGLFFPAMMSLFGIAYPYLLLGIASSCILDAFILQKTLTTNNKQLSSNPHNIQKDRVNLKQTGPKKNVALLAIASLVVAGLILLLIGFSKPKNSLESIQKEGVIKVGITGDFPPYQYYDDNEYTGIEIDLMDEAARRMGVTTEFIAMPHDSLSAALQDGSIDIILGDYSFLMSDASLQRNTTYAPSVGVVVTYPGSSIVVNSIEDLAQYTIVVSEGSGGEDYLRQVLVDTGRMPEENLIVLDEYAYSDVSEIVKTGQADAGILPPYYAEEGEQEGSLQPVYEDMLLTDEIPIYTPADETELGEEIDSIMQDMTYDGSTSRITENYLGSEIAGGQMAYDPYASEERQSANGRFMAQEGNTPNISSGIILIGAEYITEAQAQSILEELTEPSIFTLGGGVQENGFPDPENLILEVHETDAIHPGIGALEREGYQIERSYCLKIRYRCAPDWVAPGYLWVLEDGTTIASTYADDPSSSWDDWNTICPQIPFEEYPTTLDKWTLQGNPCP
ncbi:hypothetical protein ADN00_02095 [Ornatilinea apprima]|uniref:Protein kinase domain-containing protein n=1 Tax=Ornatilinea apprima TaxID=1134406 RepID=A0A0P6XC89_9CHLR|nr:transporter substrate-binding domain-containing protein [Ornatilinea apprima]KPL79932.1 hypothetical protein ADN00_02095 [Ornatilinea apprima]